MSEYKTIEIKELESYAIIYLNRPDNFNSLNNQLAEDLYSALDYISNNKKYPCIIIIGKGKAFCAGGDIANFQNAEDPMNYMQNLADTFHAALKALKKNFLSIAAINGFCFGAGLGLSCVCDLRFCSNIAKFGSAFTGIGLSPDSTLTAHLPKIVGLSLATDMILTNKILTAEEALKFNLVSRVYESNDDLLNGAKELANQLSKGATLALKKAKNLIETSFSNDLESQIKLEIANIVETAGTDDFQAGISAFLEKKNPTFMGK
ncbi:MAG: enoyl-CoA hydratase/isomerase family protein [Candidatus Lokiarchaeota archaeon]|nr:enoyl-CoA hydratase/isomerase family protein [Candidatus Lokiarchaeota archaeon]